MSLIYRNPLVCFGLFLGGVMHKYLAANKMQLRVFMRPRLDRGADLSF
jgi:hypothetical protein